MKTLTSIIDNKKQNVAVEGFASDMRNMFANIFTVNTVGKMDERVGAIFTTANPHQFKQTAPFNSLITDWANRQSYLVIGDVTVFIPVGLKCPYMDYIAILDDALVRLSSIDAELLVPMENALAAIIADPNILSSASGLSNSAFNGMLQRAKLEDTIKPISKCFDKNSKDDTTKYKLAFRRNLELNTVSERLIQLQDNLSAIDINVIEKRSKTIFSLARSIAEYLNEHKETHGEKDSVIVLSTAIKDTEEKLIKLAKK